jgi:hypothetical protein
MPIEAITTAIAQTVTVVTAVSVGMFALAWVIGSFLRGSFIPFADWKMWGNSIQLDAIKATFLIALYSSIAALITWIVNVIASGA